MPIEDSDHEEELTTSWGEKGIVRPQYGGHCISNLPDTFANILSASYRPGNTLADKSFRSLSDGSTKVVFLLLDGFGYDLAKHAKREYGFPSLERVARNAVIFPLTSVFPSTTSTATTTLHTGLTPQEHGVIGYTMYLGEIGAIVEMLSFSPVTGGRESIFDLGVDLNSFLPEKTIHEKLGASGIESDLYMSRYITGSGLSRITSNGARVYSHISFSDMLVRLRKNLESQTAGAFHFAYFASPDTVAHARGPYSAEFGAEVESLFHSLYVELFQKLKSNVAKETLLVISADHGLAHVKKEDCVDIQNHPRLMEMLRAPIAGDSRAGVLHSKSGKKESIEKYFASHLSEFEVRNSKSLLEDGFFGKGRIKEEVNDRIGDFVVLPIGNKAIQNSALETRLENMPGRHGGLSRDEMLVPFIATKLSMK